MGKILFGSIGKEADYGLDKLNGFQSPTSEKAIKFVFDELGQNPAYLFEKNVLIVVYGGASSNTLNYVSARKGIEKLWTGFIGPWYLKPLSFLFAGKCVLFKVSQKEIIKVTVIELLEKSYVSVYLVNDSTESKIYNELLENGCGIVLEKFLIDDPNAFSITIDGDSSYSKTGLYAVVRYSDKCQLPVTRILNKLRLPDHYF